MTRVIHGDLQTVRSEGSLLPMDLLRRVLDPGSGLPGLEPKAYGLLGGERLNEAITRSWNRLQKHWTEFKEGRDNLSVGEPGTGLTNDKWNLPLLEELKIGRLPARAGPEINGRTYPISRFFGPVPIHLVGCGLSLDRRAAGQRGAAASSPHGLVQGFLNQSEPHLWAIVCNGLQLRILRDNPALSRQSYLEFNLEGMFDGQVYGDFVLFWLVAHATRFTPRAVDDPATCLLEDWAHEAEEQGVRALEALRDGVGKALQTLGQGFTNHPKNSLLREALHSNELSPSSLHKQLLRVVYRLIFLCVAEDRSLEGQPLLHPRANSPEDKAARQHYATWYSMARLRRMASSIKGSRHGDLWRQFQVVTQALSGDPGATETRRKLALPELGGHLWDPEYTYHLNDTELSNHDFLEVLRHLTFIRQDQRLRQVDFRNLGAEELGGVYEGLLALSPQVSGNGARFAFAEFAGNERKSSGTYYTPDELVQCLLDSALEPVIESAIEGKSGVATEQAILNLKVCDPAVGSGHFLIGAARRLAKHLARVRAQMQGEDEPSPLHYQHALREVIGHCLYGVDINPMAAELCRVNLWLESMEPGKPLSFLDHHIRVGNSLLGANSEPEDSLPDEAFKPILDDEKAICAGLKRQNKQEREQGQRRVPMAAEEPAKYLTLSSQFHRAEKAPDDTLDQVQAKAAQYQRIEGSPEYRARTQIANTWCAAFVWKKWGKDADHAPTTDTLRCLREDPQALNHIQQYKICTLSGQYKFFHWHLAFPEVFDRQGSGFDCVLGNPPWGRVKLQEKQWFAGPCPQIANASGAERKRMIIALKEQGLDTYQRFREDKRTAEGQCHIMRNSGRYPLCGQGDINLYTVFAEAMRELLNAHGRAGVVLPTGIVTDNGTRAFFKKLIDTRALVSLLDFENNKGIFPDVHRMTKFCLLTMGSETAAAATNAEFIFFAHSVKDVKEPGSSDRRFTLSAADITLLNPNTRTCPIFRSRRDAKLTKAIYRRVPVLIREACDGRAEENSWSICFNSMFHMTGSSHLFRTREQLEMNSDEYWRLDGNIFRKDGETYLPLYEGKMAHHFDHRWATYEGANTRELTLAEKQDPDRLAQGRYWIPESELHRRLDKADWWQEWLMGWRNITTATNERTMIFNVIPKVGTGDTFPLMVPRLRDSAAQITPLVGCLSAFVFDFVTRKKIGGTHLNYFLIKQLPVLSASSFSETDTAFIIPRVIELLYTANDLAPFAQNSGYDGPPFRWDEERRFLLRAELDAAFFHLYLPADHKGDWRPASRADGCPHDETPGELAQLRDAFPTPRDAVAYIMDSFDIVRRRDEEAHKEYRTKRIILEIYDAMQQVAVAGRPYQTRLNPPPADPSCRHPAHGQVRTQRKVSGAG